MTSPRETGQWLRDAGWRKEEVVAMAVVVERSKWPGVWGRTEAWMEGRKAGGTSKQRGEKKERKEKKRVI